MGEGENKNGYPCHDIENKPFVAVDIDECTSQPCQNGGTCVDGVNSFFCKCSNALSGPFCQSKLSAEL